MIQAVCNAMRRVLLLMVVWLFWGFAGFAQDLSTVDIAAWQSLATQAEQTVDDRRADDTNLERLRAQIVEFRQAFDGARNVNSERIRSLREQLALLGEAPAADAGAAPEAEDIAAERQLLEEQLAALTAPVQVADAAFIRADGLVGEIDRVLRARQTETLLQLIETPGNPTLWLPAFEKQKEAIGKLWNSGDPDQAAQRMANLRKNLPVIIVATIAGLILIARGRAWAKQIVEQMRRNAARGLGIWGFIISLLRIILPLIGLSLLSYAALSSGYLGLRGDELVQLLPFIGGAMLGFRWVADRVFSRDDDEALLDLTGTERTRARFLVSSITLLMIVNLLLERLLVLDGASTATLTVASFPFTILVGFAVFRIGQLLRHSGTQTLEANETELSRFSSLGRVVRSLGTISIMVGCIAPLLQLAGYKNLADFILQPWMLTLVILGLILVLNRFFADVYGAVTRQGVEAREALFSIMIGFLLLLAAMPVLALIWGARVSDLTEVWAAFRRGFAIGNSRISPTDFLTFALIFTFGYLATRLAQGALRTNVLPKTKIDKGGQNAIVSGLGYVGIFVAALVAITGAGIDLSSLAIVAGALSVGIGFGLQNIVSNFVSGIILLIERPISEGDWIEVSGGQMGFVRDISVRSTRIETFDKTDVIVPNADLVSGTVINYTRGNTLGRVIIRVGVAYGTDTRKVEEILLEIAKAQPMALTNPEIQVLFLNFGASSLDFEIRIFLRDVIWLNVVKNDVNHEIVRRFAEEGIEIPFPQQDIWLRNPETLAARKPPREAAVSTEASAQVLSPDGQGEQ